VLESIHPNDLYISKKCTPLVKYYEYDIIKLILSNELNIYKNKKLRSKIRTIIIKTPSSKIKFLFPKLNKVVKNYDKDNKDANKIYKIINNSGSDKKILLSMIDDNIFNFDSIYLDSLSTLPHNDLSTKLLDILRKSKKQKGTPNTIMDLEFKITKNTPKYIDIIASELKNPFTKPNVFLNTSIQYMISYLRFIKYESETIYLYIL
jgi:hypothetical protein